ncbi:MAG: hypothetical protein M1838_003296 [Thelocarpon superellum]|nr:MAG: hypothetical protein M1838_003296 [Thelocarpon superellum]
MESAADVLYAADGLIARAASNPATATRPPIYKVIGICLAVGSGLFIGTSFVLKKKGLLAANMKYNEAAGDGYGYLKNVWWWTGMSLMILGEILNFVAYAFTEAILVTPLGALSVVITAMLSSIFLKERLSFVGKVACFLCIVGSVVIVLNAPAESSANTIQEMQHFVVAPGFLSYAGVIILICLFLALWAGPRYGKKSMLVYLSICSLIGGLSVVATQGLGAAITTQIAGTPQFNQWFIYVLLVFVIATLVTEIIFLNKALNLFNAALVTPTYYVFFTSSTIVTSAVLFQGFKGTATSIVTVLLGFLTICSGVVLLQLSKSAKDVPDTAVFTGDLDQMRTVAEQEQPESEPKADAIRGTAALIRRLSVSRQQKEVQEAKQIYEDRMSHLEPIGENEQFEWDGIRRRRTQHGPPSSSGGSVSRRKTLHPPLGLSHFPEGSEPGDADGQAERGEHLGVLGSLRQRLSSGTVDSRSPIHPVALTHISVPAYHGDSDEGAPHVFGLPPDLSRPRVNTATVREVPPQGWSGESGPERSRSPGSITFSPPSSTTRRQFSFQNVFHRNKDPPTPDGPSSATGGSARPTARRGVSARHSSKEHSRVLKGATEEERLGLVKGDSSGTLPAPAYEEEDGEWELEGKPPESPPERLLAPNEEKEIEAYYERIKKKPGRRGPRSDGPSPPVPAKDDLPPVREKDGRDGTASGPPGSGGGAFI